MSLLLSHAATLLSYTTVKLISHLLVFANTTPFNWAELPFLLLPNKAVSLSRLRSECYKTDGGEGVNDILLPNRPLLVLWGPHPPC